MPWIAWFEALAAACPKNKSPLVDLGPARKKLRVLPNRFDPHRPRRPASLERAGSVDSDNPRFMAQSKHGGGPKNSVAQRRRGSRILTEAFLSTSAHNRALRRSERSVMKISVD